MDWKASWVTCGAPVAAHLYWSKHTFLTVTYFLRGLEDISVAVTPSGTIGQHQQHCTLGLRKIDLEQILLHAWFCHGLVSAVSLYVILFPSVCISAHPFPSTLSIFTGSFTYVLKLAASYVFFFRPFFSASLLTQSFPLSCLYLPR